MNSVTVVDVLGKAIVVTDARAPMSLELEQAVRPWPRGLRCHGLRRRRHRDNIQTSNGKERIETTFQADYTFGLALKGYTWDVTNGGKSPTDAEIATGSNWDKIASDIKHTAGVVAIGDAAK